jgi:hypothetical protein
VGFTLSTTGANGRGYCRRLGSPGAGKLHAGKYRELTLSRQRGEGGGNATLLPTRTGLRRGLGGALISLKPKPRAGLQGNDLESLIYESCCG